MCIHIYDFIYTLYNIYIYIYTHIYIYDFLNNSYGLKTSKHSNLLATGDHVNKSFTYGM